MASNLDIILLAFLHAAFTAYVLLLLVFLILLAMLLSFSITLFAIVALDLYAASSTFSYCFETAKDNLQLGFALILCTLLSHAIALVSSCRPWLDRTVSGVKEKARRALNRFEYLLLVKSS